MFTQSHLHVYQLANRLISLGLYACHVGYQGSQAGFPMQELRNKSVQCIARIYTSPQPKDPAAEISTVT